MITALIGAAYLILYADFSVISVSLPAMTQSFAGGSIAPRWLVVGNALAIAGLLVVGGRLTDRFGNRAVLATGLAAYAVGALIVALAPGIEWAVAARVLQGIATAAASPATFSLINRYIPPGPRHRRALSIYGITQGLALILGLTAGGAVATHLDWRCSYAVMGAAALLCAWIAWRFVPHHAHDRGARLDWSGALALSLALVLGVFGLSSITDGTVLTTSVALPAGATFACAAFVAIERRAADPLVPPTLVTDRSFVLCWTALAVFIGCVSGMFLLTQIAMQQLLGYSAQLAGMAMIPFALAETLSGIGSPYLAERAGVRRIVVPAGGVMICGLLVLSRTDASSTYAASIGTGTVLCAAGGYAVFITLMRRALRTCDQSLQATATATMFTGMQIGVAIGTFVALTVIGRSGREALSAGIAASFYILSAALAAALIAVVIGLPDRGSGVPPSKPTHT